MGEPVERLTETGDVIAWMSDRGIRLHWIVGQFSKALGRWENYHEARVRTWAEAGAPDNALVVCEDDLPVKAARSTAIIRDGRVVAAPAWRVSVWQGKVNARLAQADSMGGPRAMREALAPNAPRVAHIEAWAKQLRALTWDGEGDEPAIPELGAFSDSPPPQLLPEPDALMADYGPVGEESDITGDMLLDAFEVDPTETAAVVKTLSATRLKHLSEQLNVTRAALDREHSATGIANPRSAAIDRLLNLLIRRGEV